MKKMIVFVIAAVLLLSTCIFMTSAEEAAAIPENAKNLAFECEAFCEIGDVDAYPADVADFVLPAWFTAVNLTDGIHNTDVPQQDIPSDMALCWYGASKKQDTDIYITIELDRLSDIYCVKIVPTDFLKGMNMPSSYTVNLSEDGDNWVQIGEEKGLSDAGNVPYTEPFVYNTEMRARYVMVHITKASGVKDPTYSYSGIDEIEAWGVEVPKATAAPTEEPVATDAPKVTDEPAQTEAGNATAAPAATEKSDGNESGNKDNDDGNTSEEKKSGLGTGAIVGIVIGAVAVIAIICAVVLLSKKKKK